MNDMRDALRRLNSLDELTGAYPVILSDVWGVLHNGVAAWDDAVLALQGARGAGSTVILISNAPRPSAAVEKQLASLGVPTNAYDAVVTSGDATKAVFETQFRSKRVTHIGPEKDRPLLDALPVSFTDDESADVCLCSGLIDDLTENPEDYRARLLALAERKVPMVCANPDKVVELGDKLLHCAGALADLYTELGGPTIIVGKPYAPIYDLAFSLAGQPEKRDVLVIGDSVRTDLKGAMDLGVSCLFITGGIHATELGPSLAPNPSRVGALLEGYEDVLAGWMPRLA